MFEPKNPFASENTGHENNAQAGLRQVSWSELNARLAAARELRMAFGEGDAEIAREAAYLHEPPKSHGKNCINPDHSTNGKRTDGNTEPRHEARRPATRGKE